MSCMVIAEAGVNHNGNESTAFQLIDTAIDARADAVKFQLFTPDIHGGKIAHLALSRDVILRLWLHCKGRNIQFACTAFDADSLTWLIANTDMPFIKLASPNVHDYDLLQVAAKANKPIIISTGMADITQLHKIEKLLRGCTITFLHCVNKYPTPTIDANLKRMNWLRVMQRPVGLSDHSGDIFMPLYAVSTGASVIECHLTMDKNQEGPDHKASLEPGQFKMMVDGIRKIESALL